MSQYILLIALAASAQYAIGSTVTIAQNQLNCADVSSATKDAMAQITTKIATATQKNDFALMNQLIQQLNQLQIDNCKKNG